MMAVSITALMSASMAALIADIERTSHTDVQLAGGDILLLLVTCRQVAPNVHSIGSRFP